MRLKVLENIGSFGAELASAPGATLCLVDLRGISVSGSFLDAAETERSDSILAHERRQQFIKSRWVIKTLLSQISKRKIEEINFEVVGEGRPQWAGSPFDFNISHSANWLLVGLGKNCRVGVDIEQIRERKNWREIAKRVFTDKELKALEALTEKEFYSLWSLKEAVLKANAGGVFKNVKEVEFHWQNLWMLSKTPVGFAPPEKVKLFSGTHEGFAVAGASFVE